MITLPLYSHYHWLDIDKKDEFKIALQMCMYFSNKILAYVTRDLVPVANLPEKQTEMS